MTNITYKVTAKNSWVDQTPTPTSRSQQAELQNFANWFQYHRSRNKMAKAGASEAFGRLGTNYRVGFDTIWNSGGSGTGTSGSTPNFPIPYATNSGLFSGTNRDTFYSRLQGAVLTTARRSRARCNAPRVISRRTIRGKRIRPAPC